MKILIAVDMEGITDVTTWDQVTPGHADYARHIFSEGDGNRIQRFPRDGDVGFGAAEQAMAL